MHLIQYHCELNAMVMPVTSKGTHKKTRYLVYYVFCGTETSCIMCIGVRKTCKEYVKQFIVAIRMD